MRKITKTLMVLALLMTGWSSAYAQEVNVTTLPWVNKGQDCTQDFNNPNASTVFGTDAGGTASYVDVSNYGTIKLYGAASQTARLFINREEAGDNGIFFVDLDANGVGVFNCNTVLTKQPKAQYIHLNGVKASAHDTKLNLSSITVSGSAIEFPEPDPFVLPDGEVEINTLPWVNQGQGCANNLGSNTDAPIYGTDAGPSDGNLSYINATDYSAVKLYGPDGTVRLFINRAEYASGTFQFYVTIKDGVGTLNLADVYAEQTGATYIHINGVKASSPGAKAQVDHITLVEKPFEFPEGVSDLTTLPYVNEGQGCVNNLGTSTDATIYGTDAGPSDGNLSYIDVTNYSAVKLYGAAGDVVRLFINRAEYGSTYTFFVTIGGDGVGTLNLADVYAAQSGATYVHINGLKASQTWATPPDADGKALVKHIGVVNAISVTAGPAPYSYTLTGAGELTVPATRALADADATSIDATGITAATSLPTANPNCLIVANDGMVTNTKNVIVSGTCANLVLEDGHPFKAPADFTATAASYTTTITAAGAGTLCLPFAATIPDGVEAWTLTYTSGDAAVVATPVSTTTIPANTPVLINGSGEKTFTGSGAVDADASNVSGALTGVFAAATVPVNSYVLQKQDAKVGFFKVKGAKTINPFRAYLTASTSAPGLSIIFPEDNDVTGISEIEKMRNADNVTIFDLQGCKVARPQKGLYIVNGKKVIFK